MYKRQPNQNRNMLVGTCSPHGWDEPVPAPGTTLPATCTSRPVPLGSEPGDSCPYSWHSSLDPVHIGTSPYALCQPLGWHVGDPGAPSGLCRGEEQGRSSPGLAAPIGHKSVLTGHMCRHDPGLSLLCLILLSSTFTVH